MPVPKDIERVVFVTVIHTDTESVERVRKSIRETRPDVVAVELDRERYHQLTAQSQFQSEKPQAVPTGDSVQDLMQQIAVLEVSLGDLTGSPAGEEMLTAIGEGRKVGAKIALVDRPIQATAQALMNVPLDEIYRLMGMIPEASQEVEDGGIFSLMAALKEEGAVDKIMAEFRQQFPNVTSVLIEQRDKYVAGALRTILDDVPGKIVVVLGAGHLQGVTSALREMLVTSSAA